MQDLRFAPIGVLKTVFTERFGVPRQSLMVSEARAVLKLNPEPAYRVALNQLDDFPIGGGNPDATCKKLRNCPPQSPLVVCAIAGNSHGSHDAIANPAFASFFLSLEAK